MLMRQYLRPRAKQLLLLAALSAASAGVSLLLLDYLNRRAVEGGQAIGTQTMLFGAALLAAVFVLRAINARAVALFGSDLIADLRRDLCKRFMELDVEKLLHRKHAVFGALIEDVERVAALVQTAPQFLNNALLSLCGAAYLCFISPTLFAVIVPFIIGSALLIAFTERRSKSGFDELRESEEELYEHFRTLGEGKKELTLNPARARHFSSALLLPAISRVRHAQFRMNLRWGMVDAWSEVMSYGWVLTALIAGAFLLSSNSAATLKFVITGLFLGGPLIALSLLGAPISKGLASLRHLDNLGLELDRDSEEATGSSLDAAGAPMSAWRTIRLEGVTYSYPDVNESRFLLGPIDLDIKRGEVIFIKGGNGSGKSTLLLLLCGLLAPTTGKILVDGRNISTADRPGYRSLFSAVFFDFALFSHPIDRLGRPAAPSVVGEWLRRLGLDERIRLENGSLSSLKHSQGLRKRIALMQCGLDDREIMILDELTADQDGQFREHFYMRLLPKLKSLGKTVIVVTHDDRYWSCAERVYGMEMGRLIEPPRPAGLRVVP